MSVFSTNKEVMTAKKGVVDELKKKIEKASSFVILNYCGLTVAEDTEFRNEFRKVGVEYLVVKNRMMNLALEQLGHKEFKEILNGPNAIAISYDDVIAPAKIATQGVTKYNKMAVKGGLTEGKFADVKQIETLAKIPAKEVLIGQLLGMLTNPMRSLAVVLAEHAKQVG